MEQQIQQKIIRHQGLPEEFGLKEVILFLWRYKYLISSITILSMIISVIIALVSPEEFQSTSKIVTKTGKGMNGGGIMQLAALSGINLGSLGSEIDISEYLPEIVKDIDFTKNILHKKWYFEGDSLYMYQILEIKPDTSIINWQGQFEKRVADIFRQGGFVSMAKNAKSGLITLSTRFPTSRLAYDVNVFCLEQLDKYIKYNLKSQANEKMKFIERRLSEVRADLAESENRLVSFKERNVNISAPKLFVEEQRLFRAIEFNQQVFIELQKQYEMARIQELNDLALIEIIQKPEISLVRVRPVRSKIAILGTIMGVLFSFTIVFIWKWYTDNFTRPY